MTDKKIKYEGKIVSGIETVIEAAAAQAEVLSVKLNPASIFGEGELIVIPDGGPAVLVQRGEITAVFSTGIGNSLAARRSEVIDRLQGKLAITPGGSVASPRGQPLFKVTQEEEVTNDGARGKEEAGTQALDADAANPDPSGSGRPLGFTADTGVQLSEPGISEGDVGAALDSDPPGISG